MAAIPTPSLIAQASAILDAATKLQRQLEEHHLVPPGFEPHSRKDWHDAVDHPDILATRSALIDASNVMLNLAMGPVDTLSSLAGPSISKVDVYRTLDTLGISQAVPMDGMIGVGELAAKVGVHAGHLHQQLRFAYLIGMFHEPYEGFVAHTSLSAAMPQISPWASLRHSRLMSRGAWEVASALRVWRDDAPSDHVQIPCSLADRRHRSFWKTLEEDDPENKGMQKFSLGMKALFASHSSNSFAPFVQSFNWDALGGGLVIDVGGGNGHIEANILKDIPSDINFLIQDLATNETPAAEVIRGHRAGDRIKFQVHDFFTDQPRDLKPKAYLLSRILHDWQDKDCARILKPLIPAMIDHGTRLFIAERILPERIGEIPNHKEQLMRTQDLLMFTLFGGGERSLSDWTTLFKSVDSRLVITAVEQPLISPFSYMELSFGGGGRTPGTEGR
ncbi:O-methyltransferase-domain-containing protein [Xylariaceae sp. FL0016]|nr:O-methyltransferase-domain-containing protein [Xylariaceae sp. FL0016]